MNSSFDTIAAVSTPRGTGGIAVIRISGPEAISAASKIFVPKSGRLLSECKSSNAVYGDILSGDGDNLPIDDGIATVFRAPRSFTGEDTVEISCHGGRFVTEKVLTAVLLSGARPAERGEFTRRAFINGRLRLEEAEAIGGILEAENDAQLKLFSRGAASRLSDTVDAIRSEILAVLSELYAKIDYPEEDLSGIPRDELPERLGEILGKLKRLDETYKTGYAVANGIRTVICGRANAGKSTLYNSLLGYEAAIVTELEGTTRDVLTHKLTLGDLTLLLYDTAGLREDAKDKVELIGIERTRRAMEDAELVLAVFDSSSPLTPSDESLIEELEKSDKTVVAVLSKSDITSSDFDAERIKKAFPRTVSVNARADDTEELKAMCISLYIDESLNLGEDAILVGERQSSAIKRAIEAMSSALSAAREGFCEDISAMYAESAVSALSESDGREVSKEIVDGIFSKFCVGK